MNTMFGASRGVQRSPDSITLTLTQRDPTPVIDLDQHVQPFTSIASSPQRFGHREIISTRSGDDNQQQSIATTSTSLSEPRRLSLFAQKLLPVEYANAQAVTSEIKVHAINYGYFKAMTAEKVNDGVVLRLELIYVSFQTAPPF